MSRKVPSRCIFFLSTRRAELMSLSRTNTCMTAPRSYACLIQPSPCSEKKPRGSDFRARPLGLPQIDRGGLALITALHLEAHALAFVEIAHTSAFDSRYVYEHIFRPVLRLDEAVAFLGIEPLHGSNRHFRPLQIKNSPPLTGERCGHTTTSNGERSGARSRLGRQAEP